MQKPILLSLNGSTYDRNLLKMLAKNAQLHPSRNGGKWIDWSIRIKNLNEKRVWRNDPQDVAFGSGDARDRKRVLDTNLHLRQEPQKPNSFGFHFGVGFHLSLNFSRFRRPKCQTVINY